MICSDNVLALPYPYGFGPQVVPSEPEPGDEEVQQVEVSVAEPEAAGSRREGCQGFQRQRQQRQQGLQQVEEVDSQQEVAGDYQEQQVHQQDSRLQAKHDQLGALRQEGCHWQED